MAFDHDAYRADHASAVKLAKVRGLELYGMALGPHGRFEGMMRSPEKAPPAATKLEPAMATAPATPPRTRRGVSQGQLL